MGGGGPEEGKIDKGVLDNRKKGFEKKTIQEGQRKSQESKQPDLA